MEFGGTDTRNITCGISPLDTVQEVKDKEHPSVLVFGGWSDVGQGHLSSSVLSFTELPHLVRPHNTPAGCGPRDGRVGSGDAGGDVHIGIEQVGLM